jgi:hypothetical protein
MNFSAILKQHGPLGLAVVVLAALLWQGQKIAQEERVTHTALLIDQMSALRHSCDPKAP